MFRVINFFTENRNARKIALGIGLTFTAYISSRFIKKTKPTRIDNEQYPIKESEIQNNDSADSLADIDESIDSSMESEESTKDNPELDESSDD